MQGKIRRVTWVGLILNVILAALKISIGLAFFSQSLVADGVHSISDMATDSGGNNRGRDLEPAAG